MSLDGSAAARALEAEARVAAYLERRGLLEGTRIVPLTGDASDRCYFRVTPPGRPATVFAVYAGPIDWATLPFASVAHLFALLPVPIPAVLDHEDDLGIVVQQDLGDLTLQARLGMASDAERAALYRQAVEFIVVMQRRGAALAGDEFVPYRLAFDVEKLTWELEFFVRHFIEGHRGVTLGAGVHDALQREWRVLADELAAEPRVLCHRDYHSRNLMWHEGRLHVIDFQDARMGPDTYDLVSLLRDSYVDLQDSLSEDLIAHFLVVQGGRTDPGGFRRRFDVMAVQRNLKALGTFGFQTAVRRNQVYVQYVPRTLRYVRLTLARHARFGRLHELLATLVPELRDEASPPVGD